MTDSACAGLVEPVCPDPVAPVKDAVSATGESAPANDAVHVAVALGPLVVTGRPLQPGIALPAAENVTVPAGEPTPVGVVTVAVRVTG